MQITETSHHFKSWDGTQIHYLKWSGSGTPKKAVVLCHRGHEYGGRWKDFVEALALEDISFFAWDARGHGDSEGKRGHAPGVGAVVRDLNEFTHHLVNEHSIPITEMIVIGHSVGAVIVATWVHDYAPKIRSMVLGTPAFDVKLYIPFAIPLLRLKERLLGPSEVKSYVKASFLTHDKAEAARYSQDSKIFPQISVRMLLDLYDTSKRVLQDAAAITTPTLLLTAGTDWVVSIEAQEKFFRTIQSKTKRHQTFDGMYHAIFHEENRSQVIAACREFMITQFNSSLETVSLLKADQGGFTKEEHDRLMNEPSAFWRLIRFTMKTLGQTSQGVQIGWKYGFDSGVMLDYVYRNTPQGTYGIGKLIDFNYLESVGWKGIRQRKVHLESFLSEQIHLRANENHAVKILDIATGGGRYLLEAIAKASHLKVSAHLQDYKQENVDAATALRDSLGIQNVTISKGDAFNFDPSLLSQPGAFDIVIVSGLYELFPDNTLVLKSLSQVAQVLKPGGMLIYTNQPWHPQLEFIAYVLSNREGKPWIMRRRTQGEMDQLVESVGLVKERMIIDEWGIFSVSGAFKPVSS